MKKKSTICTLKLGQLYNSTDYQNVIDEYNLYTEHQIMQKQTVSSYEYLESIFQEITKSWRSARLDALMITWLATVSNLAGVSQTYSHPAKSL